MNIEISGLIGLIALGLPLAALATVVMLAARDARRRAFSSVVSPRRGERGMAAATPAATLASRGAPETPRETALPVRAAAFPAPESAETTLDERFRAARHLAATGNPSKAADALRGCLWEAGSQGRKDIQAEARLVLGDVCLAAGDTITACEHWQIARDYFRELERATDVAETDRRMRSNGCPTDWVLNDF